MRAFYSLINKTKIENAKKKCELYFFVTSPADLWMQFSFINIRCLCFDSACRYLVRQGETGTPASLNLNHVLCMCVCVCVCVCLCVCLLLVRINISCLFIWPLADCVIVHSENRRMMEMEMKEWKREMLEGPYLFFQLSGASAPRSSQTWLISNRGGRVYIILLSRIYLLLLVRYALYCQSFGLAAFTEHVH